MEMKKFNEFIKENINANTDTDELSYYKKELIKLWIEKYIIDDDNYMEYYIDKNFNIVVTSGNNINLSNKKLSELPPYINFLSVKGGFDISYNKLVSMRGCPKRVGGFFDASNNELTSLEHCPTSVGEEIDLSQNRITSLEGCPNEVQSISLKGNYIENLVGAPDYVSDTFDISDNKLVSFEGLSDNFYCEGDFKLSFDCSGGNTSSATDLYEFDFGNSEEGGHNRIGNEKPKVNVFSISLYYNRNDLIDKSKEMIKKELSRRFDIIEDGDRGFFFYH